MTYYYHKIKKAKEEIRRMEIEQIARKAGKALAIIDNLITYILNHEGPIKGIKCRSTISLLEEAYKNLESFIEDLEVD